MLKFFLALSVFIIVPAAADTKSAAEQYFDQYIESGTLINAEEAAERKRQQQAIEAIKVAQLEEEAKAEEETRIAKENRFKLPKLPELPSVNLDKVLDSIANDTEAGIEESAEELNGGNMVNHQEVFDQLKSKTLIPYAIGLWIIAILLSLVSHIVLSIAAFRSSIPLGFAVLLIPGAFIVFCCIRFRAARAGLIVAVISLLCFIASVVLIARSIDPELQQSMQDLIKQEERALQQ